MVIILGAYNFYCVFLVIMLTCMYYCQYCYNKCDHYWFAGSSNDCDLSAFGRCNFVQAKHAVLVYDEVGDEQALFNPFLPTVAFLQLSFNMCCPRDCVSQHNGGTSGAPLKPLRDDSALRTLLFPRGLRGAPEVPPLCRETQSLGQQMLNAPLGINGLTARNRTRTY